MHTDKGSHHDRDTFGNPGSNLDSSPNPGSNLAPGTNRNTYNDCNLDGNAYWNSHSNCICNCNKGT
jgi:hypothetical protein